MADPQVSAWLRTAGLSRFAPRFGSALVTPRSFLHLSSAQLDSLGVDSPADRKRLVDLIADLRRTADPIHRPIHPAPQDVRPVLESLSDRNGNPLSATFVEKAHRDPLHLARRPSTRTAVPVPPSVPAPREPPVSVTVCVRKRPLSRKELSVADQDIVVVTPEHASLSVHELKEKVDLTKYVETHPFSFDSVFDEHVGNAAVYDHTARPLVDTLFNGGRATCFAYGQTGAGKTFTMAGDGAENPGLYTLAVRDVFDRIRQLESDAWRNADEEGDEDFEPPDPPQIWISFYEIYGTRLQDLLNRGTKLECREDANNEVQIVGLSERLCEVEEDVLALIIEASTHRSTGVTGANDDSSRSHAVFQIELRQPPSFSHFEDQNSAMRNSLLRGSQPTTVRSSGKGVEIGRLCFIDLAGSERGSDTASSTRQTRMEGAEINKSLLALKECIRAMDKRKDHTPFRGSKLTQVLKASFLGKNCRTVMIANISPASSNVEHTLNTLRYSDRVKEIKKDKSASAIYGEGKAGTTIRRATLGQGMNMRPSRTMVNMGSATVSKAMVAAPVDLDTSDEGTGSSMVVTRPDRKVGLFRGDSDADDPIGSGAVAGRSTARRKSRIRVRVSEFPLPSSGNGSGGESNGNGRTKDSRLSRRRTSKAVAEPISSRPSLASSMLPRAPGKSISLDRPIPRSNSVTRVMATADVDSGTDGVSRVTLRPGRASRERKRDEDRRVPSPRVTRQRAREIEALKLEEKKSESPSDSREDSPDEEKPRVRASPGRRRGPRASNAAESAMKYYQIRKKDELADEDLLFASSDEMTESAAEVKKIVDKGSRERKNRKGDAEKKKEKKSGTEGGVLKKFAGDAELANGGSSSEIEGRVGGKAKKVLSGEVEQVVRMHNMQIEEMVRLTEADCSLVQAMEKGEMDVEEYTLKLSLNLNQKLDIVKRLLGKVKALEH